MRFNDAEQLCKRIGVEITESSNSEAVLWEVVEKLLGRIEQLEGKLDE